MRPHLNHFLRPRRPPVVGDIAQQLRELPSEAAAPYDFAEFRRRGRERSAPRRQIVTWPHAAAAAGLTAFVAAMAMLGTSDGTRHNVDDGAAAGPSATTVAPGGASPSVVASTVASSSSATPVVPTSSARRSPAADPNKDPAEQAHEAREWLARQPAEPAVVRAGPRLAVASLEDRIAWFDDTLTDERLRGATIAQLNLLQQERARLVSSLAQVRYAEALVADGS